MIAQRAIPFIDLAAQHAAIRDELLAALKRVVDSGKFILGEEARLLEEETASYVRTGYAVGCASGSDALTLALWALGIQPGDEVLTAPFTFFATAGSIARAGATPVFADIDGATFNLDMDRVEAALAAHPRIRAIIPVHLFGGCADMTRLRAIAAARGVSVIEDAAQAIGAECHGGRAGGLGDVACFSFYPTKNLGGLGDGGMLTTNSAPLAARLRALRIHGQTGEYIHEFIGINSHLDALQAAALRVKLKYLDRWTGRRQQNAERYCQALAATAAPVVPPTAAPHQTRHIYNQFVIRSPRRDQLREYLKQRDIGTGVYYPVPLHLQKCFAYLGYRAGDFPASEKAAAEVLALPVNPEVSLDDVGYISEAIARFYTQPV